MSNFEKHAYFGKEAMVAVCASSMGPVSLSYCEECLALGVEPYNFMVSYIACAGEWPDDISPEMQTRVRWLLAFHNKTEEEFAKDVSAAVEQEGDIC